MCDEHIGRLPSRLTMNDSAPLHPLHRFRKLCSDNPEELGNSLVSLHKARDVEFGGDLRDFRSVLALLPMKNLDLIFSACTARLNMTLPEIGKVKQKFALQGFASTSFADTQIDFDAEETGVIPAGVEMTHRNSAGLEQFVIRIDAEALQAKLSAMVGTPIIKNIEFETQSSF